MNKKILLAILMIMLVLSFAAAQVNGPDPTKTGVTSAQQKLKEVSISKFENAGFWYGIFPRDDGLMFLRSFPGSPLDKEALPEEVEAGIVTLDQDGMIMEGDNYVLGAKVYFFRRGVINFAIKPVRPLPVEGITKTISIWVCGRNTNHRMEIVLSDHFGNDAVIDMGKLNFMGWKRLTVAVPPNIVQRDYHYNNKMGVSVSAFNIKCDLDETYGNYYLYFDDLRAVTDLFAEANRDEDDMVDSW
ncbi:MAG: flagellar filament outer layer protein FlaA [Spirochaetales bacterium]|nr:flagellar filament outer layer protein FlaA [Spirochaetales bacterium]